MNSTDLKDNETRGIYVMSIPYLEKDGITKIGMSGKNSDNGLRYRGNDYNKIFTGCFYKYIYCFLDDTDPEIIEKQIFKETIEFKVDGLQTEYRKIKYKNINNIIIKILELNNVKYIRYKNVKCDRRDDKEKKEEEKKDNLYEYQENLISKWEREKFPSGIIFWATGLGKTITMFAMIQKYIEYNPDAKILWHTKLKDILVSQRENIDKILEISGCDILPKFYIEEKPDNRRRDKFIITNSAKMIKISKKIKFDLIITDECHDITADLTYNFLEYYKKTGSIMLGASATPIKDLNKSIIRSKLFSKENDKPYVIDEISLIKGIDNKYLLPFDIEWIPVNNIVNPEEIYKNKELVNEIIKKIKNNQVGKTICWTSTINEAKGWNKTFNNELKEHKINISYSTKDPNNLVIKKFINDNDNINKKILICVDRFRQGTDDKYISLGISLSVVKDRMKHVFIQMIGRLLRKSKNKNRAKYIEVCDFGNLNEKLYDDMNINDHKAYKFFKFMNSIGFETINFDIEIDEKQKYKIINKKTGIEICDILNNNFNLEYLESIKSEYLRSLFSRYPSKEKFIEFIKINNIQSIKLYNKYLNLSNKEMTEKYNINELPVCPNKTYINFSWQSIIDPNKQIYYPTYEECIKEDRQTIKLIKKKYKFKYKNHLNKKNKLDNRLPNFNYKEFYGI